MSVPAFLLMVFGTCGIVVFIWWVMLRALTSRKSMHTGPVENAARSREQTRHNPSAPNHADDHFDDWHDDMLHETAAEAEWESTEALPRTDDEVRRSWDQSPITEPSPSPSSESSSSSDSSWSSSSDSSSSSSDSGSSSSSDW